MVEANAKVVVGTEKTDILCAFKFAHTARQGSHSEVVSSNHVARPVTSCPTPGPPKQVCAQPPLAKGHGRPPPLLSGEVHETKLVKHARSGQLSSCNSCSTEQRCGVSVAACPRPIARVCAPERSRRALAQRSSRCLGNPRAVGCEASFPPGSRTNTNHHEANTTSIHPRAEQARTCTVGTPMVAIATQQQPSAFHGDESTPIPQEHPGWQQTACRSQPTTPCHSCGTTITNSQTSLQGTHTARSIQCTRTRQARVLAHGPEGIMV